VPTSKRREGKELEKGRKGMGRGRGGRGGREGEGREGSPCMHSHK